MEKAIEEVQPSENDNSVRIMALIGFGASLAGGQWDDAEGIGSLPLSACANPTASQKILPKPRDVLPLP